MTEINLNSVNKFNPLLNINSQAGLKETNEAIFGGGAPVSLDKGVAVEKKSDTKPQTTSVVVTIGDEKFNLNKLIEERINNINLELDKAEQSNGFIGKGWSGFKNLTGIGDGSDKVREAIKLENKLLEQFNANPERRADVFKELTGQEYTPQNMAKFIKGNIKLPSEIALSNYVEGQEMAVDVIADVAAGSAAAVIYTGSVAAAPFSFGSSMAVGLTLAAGTGAVIKSSLKQADAQGGGREYTMKDWGKDVATGGFVGALGPVSLGAGGAAGNATLRVGTSMVAKQTGKQVLKESTVKTVAKATEFVTDGAVAGGLDSGFRTSVNGGTIGETLEATAEGAVVGAVFGGAMHAGGKVVSKGKSMIVRNNAVSSTSVDVATISQKVKAFFSENTKYDINAVNVLSEAVNPTNASFLDAALRDVLKVNKKANYGDVVTAMERITESNQQFALTLLKNKNVTPSSWAGVLKNADEVTIPEFQQLLKNKSFCKKYAMDLEFVNKDNIDLYKMYYNDKRFSNRNNFLPIISDANQYNKSYILKILEKYTESDSSKVVYWNRILKEINSDLKKEISDKLIAANIYNADKFSAPQFVNIISKVNDKNKSFISACIDSKQFSVQEMSKMVDVYNVDMSVRPDVLKTDALLNKLNSLSDDAKKVLTNDGVDLGAVERYLKGEVSIKSTTKEGKIKLFKNVIANNNENALLNTNFSSLSNNGVKEVIDDICSGLPEFRSVASSPQELKTLQSVQDFMKSSEYKTFSDSEKTIGKLSILFSSLKESPDAVLSRYKLDDSTKARIINIVRNKNLISNCLEGKTSAKNVVANFRNIADYKIAEHIIKADPANSSKFIEAYSKNIDAAFNELYSGQKFLFTSHILNNGQNFTTVKYNGKDIKVLNLSDMAQNEDLTKFGFPPGTTTDNVTFNVHMTSDNYGTTLDRDIETMLKLSNDSYRDFAPSSTITKGSKNSTFMGNKYGVILKNDNMNIGTLCFDEVTGTRKDGNDFARLIFGTESSKEYSKAFMQSLERNGISITKPEYAQLAKHIQSARYLTQIRDIKVGDKLIKAEQIKQAINECTDIAVGSEVTSFNPNIEALYAKVGSLDECPKGFVELADKYNLPIVLQKPVEIGL